MRPFGVGAEAAVIVFAGDAEDGSATPAEGDLDRFLSDAGVSALVAARERLLCAVVDGRDEARAGGARRAGARGARARARRAARRGLAAGAGRPAAAQLPRGALRARGRGARQRLVARRSPPTATSAPSSCCCRCRTTRRCGSTATACSARSRTPRGEYGDELLRSLEAFIEQNGQWEKAARELYCHRHTLRYRIRRVEELTGRDLSNARDRIEFWLALRARELVS